MRDGMLDHEIERRMEELNAKVLSLGSSNALPLKRARETSRRLLKRLEKIESALQGMQTRELSFA